MYLLGEFFSCYATRKMDKGLILGYFVSLEIVREFSQYISDVCYFRNCYDIIGIKKIASV